MEVNMNTSASTTTTGAIKALGHAIEDHGIEADPVSLLLLAHAARDLGVNDVLVGVMVDEDEPSVARIRAFGRVSTLVSTQLQSSVTSLRELQPAC
ncbi:MAG: hypothetical protein Q8M17_17145 [Actinomycetota bacterium]|nr:hypothetical protein [Actinomycetota bacterium]